LPVDPQRIAAGTLVCDIIMEPETTPLLKAALARGLPVHRGRAMLDQQVPSYLAFFGLPALA
jgi:shikimate dehydrogenase